MGGGELALDKDADVIDALSDIISLVGVPGLSKRGIDARLAWRDGGKLGGNIEVTEDGVALPAVGASVFGVEVSRSVFGPVRDRGDATLAAGVLAGNGGKADAATIGLLELSAASTTGFGVALAGTDMFSPAVARFSVALLPVGVL